MSALQSVWFMTNKLHPVLSVGRGVQRFILVNICSDDLNRLKYWDLVAKKIYSFLRQNVRQNKLISWHNGTLIPFVFEGANMSLTTWLAKPREARAGWTVNLKWRNVLRQLESMNCLILYRFFMMVIERIVCPLNSPILVQVVWSYPLCTMSSL